MADGQGCATAHAATVTLVNCLCTCSSMERRSSTERRSSSEKKRRVSAEELIAAEEQEIAAHRWGSACVCRLLPGLDLHVRMLRVSSGLYSGPGSDTVLPRMFCAPKMFAHPAGSFQPVLHIFKLCAGCLTCSQGFLIVCAHPIDDSCGLCARMQATCTLSLSHTPCPAPTPHSTPCPAPKQLPLLAPQGVQLGMQLQGCSWSWRGALSQGGGLRTNRADALLLRLHRLACCRLLYDRNKTNKSIASS
jgi:hypothetical protein